MESRGCGDAGNAEVLSIARARGANMSTEQRGPSICIEVMRRRKEGK